MNETFTQEEVDTMHTASCELAEKALIAMLSGDEAGWEKHATEGFNIDARLYWAIKYGDAPLPTDRPEFMEDMRDVYEGAV